MIQFPHRDALFEIRNRYNVKRKVLGRAQAKVRILKTEPLTFNVTADVRIEIVHNAKLSDLWVVIDGTRYYIRETGRLNHGDSFTIAVPG